MDSHSGATVTNGRTEGGRFGPGNKAACGSRQAHLQKLRRAIIDCVTPSDVVDVIAAMLTAAKSGDCVAAKFLFDRVFGRVQADADFPEDEIELTDDEKRQQLLNRFAKLSPEVQAEVRTKIRERKPTTLSE